ncbi:MAG TPA: hypothetical protein VN700_06235 [Vicinamibacterales bacterium]|nr:hypothetical protein [Vicinamibacterales bacterium]
MSDVEQTSPTKHLGVATTAVALIVLKDDEMVRDVKIPGAERAIADESKDPGLPAVSRSPHRQRQSQILCGARIVLTGEDVPRLVTAFPGAKS